MAQFGTMSVDADDETLVRVGDRYVSSDAAQLHIFGVLLGAHNGEVGFVSDDDLATVPAPVAAQVHELVSSGLWSRAVGGYAIDRVAAIRTMRESLDRLNDPQHCVATGGQHVPGPADTCTHCGARVDQPAG